MLETLETPATMFLWSWRCLTISSSLSPSSVGNDSEIPIELDTFDTFSGWESFRNWTRDVAKS